MSLDKTLANVARLEYSCRKQILPDFLYLHRELLYMSHFDNYENMAS
jgi:hypothetical protein